MTQRKKVLVVGMADSIHVARWLKQFVDENIDFFLVPSRKYRNMNWELDTLFQSESIARYTFITPLKSNSLQGYLDFIKYHLLAKIFKSFTRSNDLIKLIDKNNFAYIHALELQGAGYLLNYVPSTLLSKSKIIVTNYGSDIYYFKNSAKDVKLIRKVLSRADFYSAECERDYVLAQELGFDGQNLPCIPNAGGFDLSKYRTNFVPPSGRNQIIIKGYGGVFGRADIPISLIKDIATEFPKVNFFVYSLTQELVSIINSFPPNLRQRVKISLVRNRLKHYRIISEFMQSRIYVGCSASDGVSTSFLESLIAGAYPIQTSTSCASEWVSRGAICSIVPLDTNQVLQSIRQALQNDQLVDGASETNFKIAQKYLNYEVIKEEALKFYRD
jgi:glycosyltransferase involved in cell wall biosynthesis